VSALFRQENHLDRCRRSNWAEAAAEAAHGCLRESGLSLSDIDVIVAAPAWSGYRAALAALLDVPVRRVTVPTTNACTPRPWWPPSAAAAPDFLRVPVL
jgi:hypothetical protein